MRTLPWAGHARPDRQRGFSLIELLIVVSIILILITIAVPKFTHAQMFTREAAAIQAVKTIHTAEVQFQSQYGRYAVSLTELGPPASGAPNAPAIPAAAPQPTRMRKSPRRKRNALPMREAMPLASCV